MIYLCLYKLFGFLDIVDEVNLNGSKDKIVRLWNQLIYGIDFGFR